MPVVRRVLFVEDHAATRAAYARYLEANAYEVIPVGTGQEALTAAQIVSVDVIVLDLGLPDIDGWSVAQQLKASPVTAHIPIIALTGAVLPYERASAMRAGCDEYLMKPCNPPDLVMTIRRVLSAPEAIPKARGSWRLPRARRDAD